MHTQKNQATFFLLFLLSLGLIACEKQAKEEDPQAGIPGITEIRQYANNDYHFLLGGNIMEAIVMPRDGGKLISLKYKGTELLAQQDADSVAYGSTFWPSPHTWGWPPAPEIDQEVYRARMIDNELIMEGPEITSMGFKFLKTIEFSVEDTAVFFKYTIVNTTDTAVQVAPWEVTRAPRGGMALFPVAHPYALFDRAPSGNGDGLYHCLVPDDYDGDSQKISFDGTEGWLAYQRNGIVLVKIAENVSPEDTAPNQGDVEIYIDDNSDYVELELQGPYSTIAPGDSLFYETTWYLRKLDVPATPEYGQAIAKKARELFDANLSWKE